METFGKVARDANKRAWLIDCEPHVRNKLKRVFASVRQESASTIVLTDTAEHARDLLWFLERYPMEVLEPKYLKRRAREHVDTEMRIQDLLAHKAKLPTITMAHPPRDYQVFSSEMLQTGGGLLLADQVGVGKTVSAICAMCREGNTPCIIVVPAHLTLHWKRQIAEFAPQLRTHIIRTGAVYPLIRTGRKGYKDLGEKIPDVLICTYHKLRSWATTLSGVYNFVVFEECQQLRRTGSDIYTACVTMASRCTLRLGLSGTPIYNYGIEFYHVLSVLFPGRLGSYEEFSREWCNGDLLKDPEAFSAYLKREGMMLRRTRKDVGRELKPVQKIPHVIEADQAVLHTAHSDAMKLAQVILAHNERFKGEKFQAAGEFDILMRQMTGVAKAPYVADFVRMLLENGESVVLFGWHRLVYDVWKDRLKEFNPVFYTGTEGPARKDWAEQQFKTGKTRLLIMSLRSGSGVDGLQHVCHTAVIGELDWSPQVLEQCIGRVDRDGQLEAVDAYYMLSDEGSDPVMQDVLGLKYEQSEGVLNPDAPIIEPAQLDPEHVKRMAQAYISRMHAKLPQDAQTVVAETT